MAVKITNNASSLLAGNINTSSTTISVQTEDAGKFPSLSAGEWFPVTIVDSSGNMEIMRATARVGAIITVERAQEGTTAKEFEVGARVALRLTQAALEALDAWALQPIGVPIPLLSGAPLPSRARSYRYILLSAGEALSGKYNEGVLSEETVSGSAPVLTATAKIDLPSSPMDGMTINLINTSKLFLRAGTVEAIEEGQNLAHSHSASSGTAGSHQHSGTAHDAGSHSHAAGTTWNGEHYHSVKSTAGNESSSGTYPVTRAGNADAATSSAGGHTHSVTVNSSGTHSHSVTTTYAGDHSHTVSVNSDGGNENRPRNMNIQYVLRVA